MKYLNSAVFWYKLIAFSEYYKFKRANYYLLTSNTRVWYTLKKWNNNNYWECIDRNIGGLWMLFKMFYSDKKKKMENVWSSFIHTAIQILIISTFLEAISKY